MNENIKAREDQWKQALLPIKASIKEAILTLDKSGIKVALLVDQNSKLFGIISDGDIRRGLLNGLTLSDDAILVAQKNPFTLSLDIQRDEILSIMEEKKIQQIPIVDSSNEILGVYLWRNLVAPEKKDNLFVIMAGGEGLRMRPLTENCPKPLLKIAGKPILQMIIEEAKKQGFWRFNICINYLGEMIKGYFGDGKNLGISIQYTEERDYLGTAGALGLIQNDNDLPIFVTNADILTTLNYDQLYQFHLQHESSATMVTRLFELQNPFGVVTTDGADIIDFSEKPVYISNINAGIYVLNPKVIRGFVDGEMTLDMPNLFNEIRLSGNKVVAYPLHEKWIDIGRPDDFKKANLLEL